MLSENELNSGRIENRPLLTLGVIFSLVILVTICAWSMIWFNRQKEPSPTPQQYIPVILIPTQFPATAMPADNFPIYLPNIPSDTGSVSGSEQIWKVTKIKNLGYKLGSQRYDLATFTRNDGQDTVKGYCINRGWPVPAVGTEYMLTADGTFVPLQESKAHPLQRFLLIQ
jgi:hypothetical protein